MTALGVLAVHLSTASSGTSWSAALTVKFFLAAEGFFTCRLITLSANPEVSATYVGCTGFFGRRHSRIPDGVIYLGQHIR